MHENRADSFLRMIRRAQRGRLKIYLGYCAGVGKTWQMLEEARRLKREGIDVVAGLVETHGRPETAALLNGLEIVPRRTREYRGIAVEEMDVDAILRRKPQAALVDELAHTNVPGSRNVKRYQDVQDLLAAGIHVITTLNLQHLESLYDTVEKITGVRVRERLPDAVIAEADEIVNVDLTTEDLRKRLEEGKVYTLERIETALANFFRKTNLEQLRELTLREIASQIDMRSRATEDPEVPATPDQVMVCLSSRGPNSEMLLRYASRLAGRLNRNWYAVYVQTPSEEPTVIDAHTQRALSGTLTLAKQLGAMVFTYKGEDIVDTLLRFAEEYRVGHVVVGTPGPLSFWKRITVRKSTVERLIEKAEGITVVVLDTRRHEVPRAGKPPQEPEDYDTGKETGVLPDQQISFGHLLCAERIILWDEPVTKKELLQELIESALKYVGIGELDRFVEAVMESEQKGSTFSNEGAAFPHVRIRGLPAPLVSLG
ncbi:MAG: universal stress protein, partial [Syntrophobacteraceae bacterium]|nr:universal stress protein [Syntrophobacteraceae bacterium]